MADCKPVVTVASNARRFGHDFVFVALGANRGRLRLRYSPVVYRVTDFIIVALEFCPRFLRRLLPGFARLSRLVSTTVIQKIEEDFFNHYETNEGTSVGLYQ